MIRELHTIWTLPASDTTERLRRTRDALAREVAHRLPRRLAYWSLVDTGVRHLGHKEAPYDLGFVELLNRAAKGLDLS